MLARLARATGVLTLALLTGCAVAGSPAAHSTIHTANLAHPSVHRSGPQFQIQHVVIIIQENRTVDDLFNGFPGADTVTQGQTHTGKTVNLQPLSLANPHDVCHSHQCWEQAYNGGQMNGFDTIKVQGEPADFNYAYVPQSETKPIWSLAENYTFGDRMFQTNSGPSFPAHQYLISGQSYDDIANNPLNTGGAQAWGCDSPRGTRTQVLDQNGNLQPGPYPCYDVFTLADILDFSGFSWSYYATAVNHQGGIWSAFDAIKHVRYGRAWHHNVISPETQFLSDIASGQLANVTWITPNRTNSDHAGSGSTSGPQWVASLVNAVGQSQYWDNTAIFIVWDDFGGWYDHVQPQQLDNMGLGFRVPLIVVSPYARNGYVSHQQHEFGSILKFTEEAFGLPSLGQTDQRADDLSDCFDFGHSPTRFKPVRTTIRPAEFLLQRQTGATPDDD